MQKRKVPLRQCLGCRQMFEKRALVRIVRSAEGEISLDFKGKKPGRGAYVCRQTECLNKAKKTKAIERAFGCAVPEEVFMQLFREMEDQPQDE